MRVDIINKLESSKAYYVKSNNEYICDYIVEANFFESEKAIALNTLSNKLDVILLPKYRDKSKNKLKKIGLYPQIGIGDSRFLKFTIDNFIKDFEVIFFGLNGLHHEAVLFLKNYLSLVSQKNNRTCVLIDYNPENSNIKVEPVLN